MISVLDGLSLRVGRRRAGVDVGVNGQTHMRIATEDKKEAVESVLSSCGHMPPLP
jgi:hypothetical protein